MDMSYATIPVQDGSRRLYSGKITPYVVSSQDRPDIHHTYAVDTDLGSSIFFNDTVLCDLESTLQMKSEKNKEGIIEKNALEKKQKRDGLWTMYFDGPRYPKNKKLLKKHDDDIIIMFFRYFLFFG